MNRVSKSMRTILVVDDYDDVRGMLRLLLESEGFRVLEAATGPEALSVTRIGHPHVILMDLALPGLDGFETIRRIRKIDGFQNTPIIVLTAYSGESVFETALSVGATHLLGKPIDFEELAELLTRILADGTSKRSRHDRSAQRAVFRKSGSAPGTARNQLADELIGDGISNVSVEPDFQRESCPREVRQSA